MASLKESFFAELTRQMDAAHVVFYTGIVKDETELKRFDEVLAAAARECSRTYAQANPSPKISSTKASARYEKLLRDVSRRISAAARAGRIMDKETLRKQLDIAYEAHLSSYIRGCAVVASIPIALVVLIIVGVYYWSHRYVPPPGWAGHEKEVADFVNLKPARENLVIHDQPYDFHVSHTGLLIDRDPQSPERARDPWRISGAIRGHILPLRMDKQRIDLEVFNALPPELRANNPGEAGTLLRIMKCKNVSVSTSLQGGGTFTEDGDSCPFEIVDVSDNAVVGRDEVTPFGSTASPFALYPVGGRRSLGRPTGELVDYVKALPKR